MKKITGWLTDETIIYYIDLGKNAKCMDCNSRYCTCKWRRDSKENELPVIGKTLAQLIEK